MTAHASGAPGTVYLVGAGPGDPGLLTVRAVECLRRADVVLYDYLVNPAAVAYAASTAELVPLGRHGVGRSLTPDAITERMLAEALSGKTVVRLKGGDPSIFGRGGDEIPALRAAGIPFEIVPGVTAGLAVAAYCEIPLTQHDDASAVALITGRERGCKPERHLDYGALAAFPGTLVIYMGVGTVAEWSRALIDRGRDGRTPVAIVRWCTRGQQRTVRCTLETVADTVATTRMRPPVVFVVGDVVDRAPACSWFAARPLVGTRVLVPAVHDAPSGCCRRLAALGADVTRHPVLHAAPPPDWTPVDRELDWLDRYAWMAFTSPRAVDGLLGRLLERGDDLRVLGHVRLAAGPRAAARLRHYHLRADLVLRRGSSRSLAGLIAGEVTRGRCLVVRGCGSEYSLRDARWREGNEVTEVAAYSLIAAPAADPSIAAALAAGEIDWIVVTDAPTVRPLVRLYGDALRHARVATVGPRASAALRGLGHAIALEAAPHTAAALVAAMVCTHLGAQEGVLVGS